MITAAFAAAARYFPGAGAYLIIAEAVLIIGLFTASAIYRYARIKKLSAYLSALLDGAEGIRLMDCREGELSFLQSEIYKLTQKLTEQAELLRADKNYLAGAISDISHQLKTPVTSMTVMTELLKDEALPAKKRLEFTRNIQNQLKRMEWLVSALLKMAKLDAGSVTLKMERFKVSDLIKKATGHLLIPMELRAQTLTVSCAGSLEMTGDIAWLAEALANIVKNCVEHTPEGGRIAITAEKNPLYIELKVSDTGCGIDKADLPYIFQRFYKGKNSAPDSVGIGLAMAKQIINNQGGTLKVESSSSEGTCFVIKFYREL